MRVVSATMFLLAATLDPASADTCSPARAMIVLDRSSSMVTGFIGNQTKWDVAVAGIDQVLAAYEMKAEFGLMTFPQPNQCGAGRLDVAPAMGNRSSIASSLDLPPPQSGNWTPMAQTLDAAAAEPTLVTAQGAKHVILVTDGWQWCSPYDPATRFDGTDAVAKLDAAGVTTWIVGFGAEVDAAALNQMAVVADTKKAGCNPANTDPTAPDNCYYQVDNAQQLVAALTAISNTIVANELCDGIDNDCDGKVDDDLSRACSNACGSGVEVCGSGAWGGCSAPQPVAESCDGVDNDCNGNVDDNAPCANGDVCTDGMCQPAEEPGGAMHAGCCDANGGGSPASIAMFLVLGAFVMRRRRR